MLKLTKLLLVSLTLAAICLFSSCENTDKNDENENDSSLSDLDSIGSSDTENPSEDESDTDGETNGVHVHNFSSSVIYLPTCTSGGYTLYTCSDCSETKKENVTEKLEHDFTVEFTFEPTCTLQGYILYKCSACSETKKENTFEKLEHDFKFEALTESTCTEKGYTLYKCSSCTATKKDDYTDLLSHSFGDYEIINQSTFDKEGLKKRTCLDCPASETEAIPKIHLTLTYTSDNGIDKLNYESDAAIEFSSYLISHANLSDYDNVTVVGEYVSSNDLEIIRFGKNITKIPDYGCNVSTASLFEVIISKDVEYIGTKAFWNSENLKKMYFEGDAPRIDDQAFLITCSGSFEILPTESAKGFEGILFGGMTIVREWIVKDEIDVFSLTLNEYSHLAARDAEELAKSILKLYSDKNQIQFAYIPYTEKIEQYKIIKDFTIQLTKHASTEKEKIDIIYDWIVDNVSYSDDALKYDPYQVFVTKKAICAGYVTLMHDMLAAVDIVSFYTRGSTLFGNMATVSDIFNHREKIETHAWLTICLSDGSFTRYDPTWGVSNKEAYRDMNQEDLANHAVTFEVDGLEVIINGADHTLYKLENHGDIQFLYEDGYIYAFNNGICSANTHSTDYYNYWFAESFFLRNDSVYRYEGVQPMASAFNNGIVSANYISGNIVFCRADGRLYPISRVVEFAEMQNKYYGKSITFSHEFICVKDGMIFNRVQDELALVCYFGTEENITVPAYVDGLPVKVIGAEAFYHNKYVRRIVIENGIEEIWVNSFYNCENLEYVYLPASMKYNTASEQWLGTSSIKFERCFNISCIEVSPDNPNLTSLDGNLYSKDMKELICFAPNNQITEFTLPSSVEKIGPYAFSYTKVKSVKLNDGLKVIGDSAFWFSEIEEITVPGGIELSDYSFAYCSYLKSVTIEEGVTKIPTACFIDCHSLIEVNLPSTVSEIGDFAFATCTRLYMLTLPEGLKTIGSSAFCDASLVSITLPSTLEEIMPDAFLACNRLFVINNLSALVLERGSEDFGGIAYYAIEINSTVNNENIHLTDDGLVFYCTDDRVFLVEYISDGKEFLILPETFMDREYFLIEKVFADFDFMGWETRTLYDFECWEIDTYHSGKNVSHLVIPKSVTYIPLHAFTGWESFEYICYAGTESEWQTVYVEYSNGSNSGFEKAAVAFYSENEPTTEGIYWRYVDGVPTVW